MSGDISNVNLFPKQQEFINATERMVLYCGGTGSGKSHAMVYKLFIRASHPGACEGLARKINADIPNSFIKDWKRFIPAHLYEHQVNAQVIKIKGGGQIEMFGCDDIERIGSRNLTGCGIEEAVQLTENDWQKIDSVVRVDHPLGNQLYGVCNPDGTTHWLYEYFQIDRQCPRNRRYIPTTVEDGYLGSKPEYVEAMKAKTGIDRMRRYLAMWCDAEGAIFDSFSEANVCERMIDGRIALGVDDGDTAPFVVLKAHCDGFNLHISDEFYRKGVRSLDGKCERVKTLFNDDVFAVVVDLQAAHVIEALQKVGLPACKSKKGNNSIEMGVAKISTLLTAKGSDGRPRLTVSPKCVNLIREFKSWSYAPSGDYGRNNNHALDALKYLVFFFELGASDSATYEDRGLTSEETPDWAREARHWQPVESIGELGWA